MFYLIVIGIGILLVGRGIYVLLQIGKGSETLKNQSKAAYIIIIIGIICIVGSPASFVMSLFDSTEAKPDVAAATTQQQTIQQMTFEEFKDAYATSAKRFAAPTVTDWSVSNGEKVNTVKIQINTVSNILISMKKEVPNYLIGTMFFVSASDDSLVVLQALTAFYALTAVFEPQKSDEQIADLVNQILDAEKNTDYSLAGGMICAVNSVGSTEVITYRYE